MSALARRLFLTASVLLFLTGLSHLYGQLNPPEGDFSRSLAEAAMRHATKTMGGMTFNLWGVMMAFGWYFSVYAMLAAAQNILAVYASSDADRTVRILGAANALVSIIAFAVAWHYSILPPIIGTGVQAVLFGAATVLAWQKS